MSSTYFTLPSFARAKRHQEELEKSSNPKEPVLKEEDEKFLERHLSIDEAAAGNSSATTGGTASSSKSRKEKDKTLDLPSQEEAEAATQSWNSQNNSSTGAESGDNKRTWTSYIPAGLVPSKDEGFKQAGEKQGVDGETGQKQTWAMYASQYVPSSATTLPSLPAMPAIPALSSWYRSKDKDATPELVYKEDGTIDEAATKEKQEKEVSVLLDNLNMSSINNRVFALSGETHKIYERFAFVLKDTIEGGPTAYEDMEKLMKDAGPTLEKQFQSMPPFVQTLVKSLPAKMGLGLAPEFLATLTGDKPDDHLKTQDPAAPASAISEDDKKKKEKRKIPGLKKLISQQGAVATMLRNTVTFITTRFPFLASTTNVVMSLSVFILMFVFWYCHKRGREARLARTNEGLGGGGKVDGEVDDVEDDEIEADSTDDEVSPAQEKAEGVATEAAAEKKTEKVT